MLFIATAVTVAISLQNRKVCDMKRILLLSILFVFCGTQAAAQVPEVRGRWFPLTGGDSLLVEYASPPGALAYPAVLVLSDRFGQQENVRSMLKVLAQMGFHAYAPPLRSAPLRPVSGVPSFTYDSSDAEIITQVAVDVMNREHCNGKIGLLALDAGAVVAIDMVRRFPFFQSAALLYPAGGLPVLERLLQAQTVLQLHVAQFDPECSLENVKKLRTQFIEAGRRLHVFYYKEAHRFFFNPEHERYHRKNTQTAWNKIMSLYRSTLR